MKNLFNIAALSLMALMLQAAHADENEIRQALSKSMPDIKIESIKPSEINGLFEVKIGSTFVYVSEDGKYLLHGRLIDVATRTDLTESRLTGARKQLLAKLTEDQLIVFKPKISKYAVYVFTDIDCGYCRKLHSEIDQYMAEGITVNYLFYPRAGKPSESYDKAVSVWCAKDRKAALTASKKGDAVPTKTCANPVDAHMKLAEEFDVKGTPMIVTAEGAVFPGYLPAKQLVQALESEKVASK
ncbi:MAG: DsbC family protein [Methylococcales bacterium]|nr:DsbC family protein [Methylococcaceae bacterium]